MRHEPRTQPSRRTPRSVRAGTRDGRLPGFPFPVLAPVPRLPGRRSTSNMQDAFPE